MSNVDEQYATTVATWVYQLHAAGVVAQDDSISEACGAVWASKEASEGEAAATRLVEAVRMALGSGSLDGAAQGWFPDRVLDSMGEGERDERTTRMRRHQFNSGLPWLAQVFERRSDGAVAPHWLLVERVTDQVSVMDPNPWDDVDEERCLPLGDFQVLWELTGCSAVAVK